MNSGVDDALKVGIPADCVNPVMRKFIPPLNGTMNEQLLREAQSQAVEFDTGKGKLEFALVTTKSRASSLMDIGLSTPYWSRLEHDHSYSKAKKIASQAPR